MQIQELAKRLKYIKAMFGGRKWERRVGDLAYNSVRGTVLHDIRGGLDPLFLHETPTALEEYFVKASSHDFSRGSAGLPPWNSEPDVARFLAKWVALRRPASIVELGSFIGYTTSHIAAAVGISNSGATFHSVEIDERNGALAAENVADLLPEGPMPQFHIGSAIDPQILQKIGSGFELVFLDTSHEETATRKELEVYLPRLAAGGMIALHDTIKFPGVRRAFASIPDDKFGKLIFATSQGCGMGLAIRRP